MSAGTATVLRRPDCRPEPTLATLTMGPAEKSK
jgi:hypothetical protein